MMRMIAGCFAATRRRPDKDPPFPLPRCGGGAGGVGVGSVRVSACTVLKYCTVLYFFRREVGNFPALFGSFGHLVSYLN